MNSNKITNALLLLLVLLVTIFLFKDKLHYYLIAKNSLKRANILNIPGVASWCNLTKKETKSGFSDVCMEAMNRFGPDIIRWENLIKQYRKIDCNDFRDGEDAKNFFNYISGELSDEFYVHNEKNFVESKYFSWISDHTLHCSYDPYGLDADGDCNACEAN